MSDLYLEPGESLVRTTHRISISYIPFDVMLTNERLILIDNEKNRIPPQVIPLSDIFSVKGAKIATGEPVITIAILDPDNPGTPIPMALLFSQRSNEKRTQERDDWLRSIMEYLVAVRQEKVLDDLSPSEGVERRGSAPVRWIAPEILYPAALPAGPESPLPKEVVAAVETPAPADLRDTVPGRDAGSVPGCGTDTPVQTPVNGPGKTGVREDRQEGNSGDPGINGAGPGTAVLNYPLPESQATEHQVPENQVLEIRDAGEGGPDRAKTPRGIGTPRRKKRLDSPEITVHEDVNRVTPVRSRASEREDTPMPAPPTPPPVVWPVIPEPAWDPAGRTRDSRDIPETRSQTRKSEVQDRKDQVEILPGPVEIRWPVIPGPVAEISVPAQPELPENGRQPSPPHSGASRGAIPENTVTGPVPELPVRDLRAGRGTSEGLPIQPADRADASADEYGNRETVNFPAGNPGLPNPGAETREGNDAGGRRKIILATVALIAIILAVIFAAAILLPGHPAAPTPVAPPVINPIVTTAPAIVPSSGIPQTGLWVSVTYPRYYYGTAGNPGDLQEVSGSGRQFYSLRNPAGLVQADIQKQDDSGETLKVDVWLNGADIYNASVRKPRGTVNILIDPRTGKTPV